MGKATTSASPPATSSAASQHRRMLTSPHVSCLPKSSHVMLVWVLFIQGLTVALKHILSSGPCPPQRVAVDLQCGSHTAVLSWEERSDVQFYIASAVKASGGEVQKCNSTGSTCQFPGLACGETYNFTVTAHTHGCSSKDSHTVFIQTGTADDKQFLLLYALLRGGK